MTKDVEKTIREIAQKQAEEKHQQIIKEMEEKLEADVENVNKVLDLIEKHLLYYKDGSKYILVTPDLFYKHYMEEYKGYRAKGIFFKEGKSWGYVYKYIQINNVDYHYFDDLLNNYETDLKECIKKTSWQLEELNAQKRKYEELKEQEPIIKKMIEEYIEFTKQLELESEEECY